MVLVAPGGDRAAVAQQPDALRDAAMRQVAARAGVPAGRLAVVGLAEATYPAVGLVGAGAKVLDTASGVVYSVSLDRQGQPLDAAAVAAADRVQRAARGPVEPALADRLGSVPPDAPIPVAIWLRESAHPRAARPVPARAGPAAAPGAVQAFDAAAAASRTALVQQVVAPVGARLRQAGISVGTAGTAPVVYARVPAGLLAEVSAGGDVDRVYLARFHRPELDVAVPTVGGDLVRGRNLGGANVRVAQIEPHPRLAAANPYLDGVLQDATYACSGESAHATAVAGVLRSTHPVQRGIAPDVSLRVAGSCSGASGELNERASAAAEWGARVFSLSYGYDTAGVPNGDDRFYDDLVFHGRRTVVKSSSNYGLGTGNASSPGLGYNVITVGNFDDRNTLTWADDRMNPSSSYVGPTSAYGDRRKPELAAPGTNVSSLSLGAPWDYYTSTGASFATPLVAGTAALLVQRNGDLALWPEAVKAILMATAVNPLQGSPSLAGRGGVGGLVADRADDVARWVNGDWGAGPYNCSTPSPSDVAALNLGTGQRARAVLAWDTDPGWAGWPMQPGADLDLAVVGPENKAVGVSASHDNSYEVVDFTAPAGGVYRLRVSRGRCDSSPEGIAWAWHLVAAAATERTPTSLPATPTRVPATTTATPTARLTATATGTPAPAALCTPTRPPVTVSVTPRDGRLDVTIAAATLPGGGPNTIRALRFGPAANAAIAVGDRPAAAGDFAVSLPAGLAQTSFSVRRAAAGQATTVPLTVTDGCGDWPTVVGGGPQAF